MSKAGRRHYFEGSGFTLSGDAVIRLRDATATFELDAPAALTPTTTALLRPANGILNPGAMAGVQLTPSVGPITHASIGFVPSGGGASAFSVEFPSSQSNLSVSGNVMAFNVPADTAPAPGALELSLLLAITPTLCQGPAACSAQTGGLYWIESSVESP